jgi:formylglycine-generating enzyme required for sulfatase activity
MRLRLFTTVLICGVSSLTGQILSAQPAAASAEVRPSAAGPVPADTAAERPAELLEGMVLVSGGPFIMGTDVLEGLHNPGDAGPQHTVALPPFYIDKTEVTNAQYKRYCDATGYPVPPHWKDGSYAEGQGLVPVTWVNWWEAQAYAAWKGKRLPTEAEWEKAARGTDGRAYPWGSQRGTEHLVWGAESPRPVGSKPGGASPCGALDMAGNVFEWTGDWYDAYPGARLRFAQFGTKYKVIRGGGFDGALYETAAYHRSVTAPRSRSEWVGFRCVRAMAGDR